MSVLANKLEVPTKDDEIPAWATSEAWAETARIVENARHMYHKVAPKLDAELRGQFIAIDSERADCYVIGQTEAAADEKFRKAFPDRKGALFEIGCVSL